MDNPPEVKPVLRAKKKKTLSKQPRFKDINPSTFYMSTLAWVRGPGQDCPEYLPASAERDSWLSDFAHLEPHLAGVLNSVVSIDANRGWTLEGGRNQVMRYTDILRGWQAAPGLIGWRPGVSTESLAYYTTDIGWIGEIGRDGKNGPARGFYHVDPTRCQLTGDDITPLRYTPPNGNGGDWAYADFMRGVSMPSIKEKYNGLGYCAVSRCLELAKIMVAVYEHDREQLGAQAPRGLLLLKGITEEQWNDNVDARKARLTGEGMGYFDAVEVLASLTDDVDAKMVALSSLPENFDLQAFTSMLMYAYALCLGYDPSEFYPVQFGGLSQGTEARIMSEKATGKGGLNFIFTLQEQLQRPDVLPPSLDFEFDQRDEEGEIAQAQVAEAWVNVYRGMRETGLQADMVGGISQPEFRQLLADKNLIPKDWTEVEEDIVTTDEQPNPEETAAPALAMRQLRDRLLSRPHILAAAERYPLDDLIQYSWPTKKVRTVWPNLGSLTRRMLWPASRAKDAPLYQGDDFEITVGDVDRAINEAPQELQALLNAKT